MFGPISQLNSLQSRKQLLLAESELNRAHLIEDLAALTADVRSLTEHAQSFNSITSSAAMLVTGLAALRGAKPPASAPKRSWMQTLLNGAGLLSLAWRVLRSKGSDRA